MKQTEEIARVAEGIDRLLDQLRVVVDTLAGVMASDTGTAESEPAT